MSSIEISSVFNERMEKEELLTALGLYGHEASKQRDMVQHGKKLCGIIHSSAEKCGLPTELLGPGPFDRSPSLNDLKSVAQILKKHTDEGQTRAFNCTLYGSRLHIEALQVHEYLGKFIDNSVKETSEYIDFVFMLPKELYNEFAAITIEYIHGAEISSIDYQIVKLTEKVALACGHETATAFSGIGYRLILLRVAMDTHQSLEKFIHRSLVKALPSSVVFLRSHEDIVPSWYAPRACARACFSSMIPKEDVEAYERLGISLDNLHVRIIDIPEKKHDFLNICTWHEESHGLEDALKNVRKSDHMVIISSSILAMSAQAGGSFLSGAFADHTSNRTGKWGLDFVEAAMLAGFGLTIGGMGIHRVKPEISGFLIKSGAIGTAWAFIASLAIPLSPVLAWTVGPIAAGFVAASIGLA